MKAGTVLMPQTRIRKRGMAVSQSLKMRRLLKTMAVYVSVIFLFSLGYVWTRVQVVESGYRLRKLEEQRDRLKEANRSLLVESATLKSPQRMAQIAKQMGLQRPVENQIVFLKKENLKE
ncbi:MAG TPA: cell division protein FtsL [bacterium]|nr:cell division protein FtsL [bacterium]